MQQISVKLATAIALSSALLLTACGGSSDSSGDKTASKIDTLVGYWKGECDTNYKGQNKDSTLSSYDYVQLVKDGENVLKIEQIVGEIFTNNNCSGKGRLVKDEDKSKVLTQDELDTITLQGNKVFIIESNEGKDKYNRIKAEDFPVGK